MSFLQANYTAEGLYTGKKLTDVLEITRVMLGTILIEELGEKHEAFLRVRGGWLRIDTSMVLRKTIKKALKSDGVYPLVTPFPQGDLFEMTTYIVVSYPKRSWDKDEK